MSQNDDLNGGAATGSPGGAQAESPKRIGAGKDTTECDLSFYNGLIIGRDGVVGLNHDIIARWVLQDNVVAHLIETENTLIYRDGVYEDFAEARLQKLLYDVAETIRRCDQKSLITRSAVNEILARVNSWSLKNIGEFENNRHIYNLANGVLDLDTYELMPHSPDFMFLSKSPTEYDPDAECPMFGEFLDQCLDKKYHDLIGEIIGYTLWPEYNIHKGFMFLGPKRTGKGTMLRTIEELVGRNSCSHVSLQDLMDNRFMRARLFGKKLNTYGDLPATEIKDAGIFKNVTGEDTIDAENKYEHPFSFKNNAKLLFSANRLPKLKVPDDAFYGRWIIVPFENSFYGKEDSHLTKKLTTPEELSGLLNFALDGLDRLEANGWKFTYGEDGGAVYRRKSNPLIGFLEDRCELSPDDYVVKSDLINAYNEYAKEMGFPPSASKKSFGKEMMDQTIMCVETCHPKVGDRQQEAWRGIKIKV